MSTDAPALPTTVSIVVGIGSYEVRTDAEGKRELFDIANESTITDMELAKLIATQALDGWWATLAIDVAGAKLPIESAFNANSVLTAIALSADAAVVDINDVTIIIPAAEVKPRMNSFRQDAKLCMDAWDRVRNGIAAATTVDELLALSPSSPISFPAKRARSRGVN